MRETDQSGLLFFLGNYRDFNILFYGEFFNHPDIGDFVSDRILKFRRIHFKDNR